MSKVIVTPSKLQGEVQIPPSKSDVHRAILCAALSKGISKISPVAFSEDIKATISCINSLGTKTTYNKKTSTLTVDGTSTFTNKTTTLNCNESGSTLRFLIPIAAAGNINATFTGKGRLPNRPIGIYLDELPKANVKCTTNNGLPLTIKGQLTPGTFTVPGNISSQFITGFLLALPLLKNDSKIVLTSPLESVGYINMTINTMKKFGVNILQTEYGYFIKGNQKYKATNYTTEGDWSQAAFFLVAGALQNNITVKGVNINSTQGDKEIINILKDFGAKITVGENYVNIQKSNLKGINISAKQIPDLVPILAVVACFAKGTTLITDAERLRIKESDRLNAIATNLNIIGGKVTELKDGLKIKDISSFTKGNTKGYNDHRIVMALSIATTMATDNITITDATSINKSYPTFLEDYINLGGKANVINMGK